MKLPSAMLHLLAWSIVLALLRHLVFLELVLTDPSAVVESLERRAVVLELPAAQVLPMIESGEYQAVDLRRDSTLPVIGLHLAWSLPMPHSMTILSKYIKNATARRLAFIVDEHDRDEGLKTLRRVCQRLGVREAILVVGGV